MSAGRSHCHRLCSQPILNLYRAAEFFCTSGDIERMQAMGMSAIFFGSNKDIQRASAAIDYGRCW